MSADAATRLWAPRAWLVRDGVGAWRERVALEANAHGRWFRVEDGVAPAPDAMRLDGPALPGLVDAHSHAFQRAFAGLAETRDNAEDDFWSWRDRMYGVALRVEPDALAAIAAQLYAELLAGGYTQVCEFHYLQHAPDGSRYGDAIATSRALADAAARAGIGLTVLPVLYERAGFAQPALRDDQRRFALDAEGVIGCRDAIRALGIAHVDASVAVHSLRAASAASIARLVEGVRDDRGPIHIHVAEQRREVDDCLAATGSRPIAWLAEHVPLDVRWQLVHATHATPDEIAAVARTGATVVLCPTTEANLGDGAPDLPRWLMSNVPLALGSDSNVRRDWAGELESLEYGQRLRLERRNVAANLSRSPSTAGTLFATALDGGRRAAGFERWGLVEGARADLVVLDDGAPGLSGVPDGATLDAFVFSAGARAIRDVMVAGRWTIRERVHREEAAIARDFVRAMRELWP